ncbi:hypothetical protein CCHL11_07244 [Colletotrichum chlorophyti]|uniref:Uncharacterized protein n=1 Tax=Colletotrichum chlorophyti TaxID=708187 RepID=A0A1Q8RXA3_9PEZI|nr:hypothetical protein CCHL11_07244 [Colletotrichum chlorophyti]
MYLKIALPALLAARFVAAAELPTTTRSPVLVTPAEDHTATTAYTDFFTPDGMRRHCPPTVLDLCECNLTISNISLTLRFIADNNASATVYEAHGRIENNFKAGNGSQIYYKTQYTVLETVQTVDVPPNLST